MKVKIDGIGIVKDEKYYRINISLGTHRFHSEKLNRETASDLLFQLESED